MPSKAERQRARKARSSSLAAVRYQDRPRGESGAVPVVVVSSRGPRGAYQARADGLDLLRARNRITAEQAVALRAYGALYRSSQMDGGASIRSSMDDSPVVHGRGGGLPTADLAGVEWIAHDRVRLELARAALNYHVELIAVVDLICGQGLRPREISDVQRETEQIETALRLAGDMLDRHFAEEARRGRAA